MVEKQRLHKTLDKPTLRKAVLDAARSLSGVSAQNFEKGIRIRYNRRIRDKKRTISTTPKSLTAILKQAKVGKADLKKAIRPQSLARLKIPEKGKGMRKHKKEVITVFEPKKAEQNNQDYPKVITHEFLRTASPEKIKELSRGTPKYPRGRLTQYHQSYLNHLEDLKKDPWRLKKDAWIYQAGEKREKEGVQRKKTKKEIDEEKQRERKERNRRLNAIFKDEANEREKREQKKQTVPRRRKSSMDKRFEELVNMDKTTTEAEKKAAIEERYKRMDELQRERPRTKKAQKAEAIQMIERRKREEAQRQKRRT